MPSYPDAIQDHLVPSAGNYFSGPYRIVHHTTEGSSYAGARATYLSTGSAPHFTVDDEHVHQHLDTDVAATALANHSGGVQTNRLRAIQIEVVGFAGAPKDPATLQNVAKLCRWIEATHHVPRTWPNGYPQHAINGHDPGGHNRNAMNWVTQGGHYGHSQVPENSHWDPGYTLPEIVVLMGEQPKPRLIGAVTEQEQWHYYALPAQFAQDHFVVVPHEIAARLGRTGGGNAPTNLRDAVTSLNWEVSFNTDHLGDAADPRVYMWVYG